MFQIYNDAIFDLFDFNDYSQLSANQSRGPLSEAELKK